MSVNKFISKLCNLPEELKEEDIPSPSILSKAFLRMQARIIKMETGSFRPNRDEMQLILLALEKAMQHGLLQDENDRLSELEERVNVGRKDYLQEGGGNDPSGKAARKMVRRIGVPRKKKDWSRVYSDFMIHTKASTRDEALIYTAKHHGFSNISPLIQGLRRCGVKDLPSHTSEFAQKPISSHKASK
jgi:hypothetical protein